MSENLTPGQRICPDTVPCEHACVASCWRVGHEPPVPLPANYRNGEWPGELIRRQLVEEQARSARLLANLQTQGSRLRQQEEQRAELEGDVERARGIAVALEQENAELERSLRWFRRGGEEYEVEIAEREAPVARLRAMPEPACSLGAGPVYDLPDGAGLAELAQATLDRLGRLGDAFRQAGPPEVQEAMRALDHAAATGRFPEEHGPGDVPG